MGVRGSDEREEKGEGERREGRKGVGWQERETICAADLEIREANTNQQGRKTGRFQI